MLRKISDTQLYLFYVIILSLQVIVYSVLFIEMILGNDLSGIGIAVVLLGLPLSLITVPVSVAVFIKSTWRIKQVAFTADRSEEYMRALSLIVLAIAAATVMYLFATA